MTMRELRISPDADSLAVAAASVVAERIRVAVSQGRRFTFAVSGGRTPWAMLDHLCEFDVAWSRLDVFQVDERVAPAGDENRNLTHLLASLPPEANVMAMPVGADDLDAASRDYAVSLPPEFDLVHLGLGPDGHTASLVPGDLVLTELDRDVAVTQPYQGHRRMTLTYPVLSRAHEVLWLVSGIDKRLALTKLLADDPSIPASGVRAVLQLVLADEAAAGRQ